MAMDWRVATAVTLRVVDAEMEAETAWMVVLPTAFPVARPDALMVAALVLLEVQVTEPVRFCVVPLL